MEQFRGRAGLRGRAREFNSHSQNGVQEQVYYATPNITQQYANNAPTEDWDDWASACQTTTPVAPPSQNFARDDFGGFRGGGRGRGGGFRGSGGGYGQSENGGRDDYNQTESSGGFSGRGGGYRGGRGGGGRFDNLNGGQDDFNQSEEGGGFGRRGGGGRGGGFRGGRGGGGGGRFEDGGDGGEETEMFVPKSTCGRIIGKAGSRIQELQSESGAGIKIHSQDSNDEETRIVLTGSEDQRTRAKQLIEEVVAEASSFGGGGRRGGGGGGFGGSRGGGHQGDGGGNGDTSDVGDVSNRFGRMMNRADDQNRREREEALASQEIFPVVKHFYKELPEITTMTAERRAEVFASLNNIIVNELESLTKAEEAIVPNPVTAFAQAFHPYPEILEEIEKQGFERPSPIQCMAWPSLLSGRDFIGIAQTGTGKTLAFLLPGLIHIEGQTRPRAQRAGPTVLVLSPTRELALQIQSEVIKYSYRGIKCVCVYGGADRRAQMLALGDGPEIVVATPGRLNDLLDSDKINLSEVSYLVLDEADRMLDMGFEPQVVKTLWQVRKDRQTVMTSATWPASVHRIAKTYMTEPIQVNVGSLDLNACHDVTQVIEFVYQEEKRDRLMQFITEELQPNDKVLIFVGRKLDCSYICSDIQCTSEAPNATCIHGDLDQESREDALDCLRQGDVPILVATDLASRGIDIKDITYVINYDFPRNIEEYVHRVGRTGRAGRKGIAITLMTRSDSRHADELIDILREAKQIIPPELEQMAIRHQRREAEGGNRRGGRGGGGFRRGGDGGGGGRRNNFF